MAETNFLSNSKNIDEREKMPLKEVSDVLWTKPVIDDKANNKISNKISNKKNAFHLFDFFIKNKNVKKSEWIAGQARNDKIEHSREEVLKLIKQTKNQPVLIKQEHSHEVNKLDKVKKIDKLNIINTWLKAILNKKNQKKILIDYQAIFNKEMEKRSSIQMNKVDLPETKVSEIKVKEEEKKVVIVTPIVVPIPPVIQKSEVEKVEKEKFEQAEFEQAEKEKPKPAQSSEELKQWENPNVMETNLIKDGAITYFDWHGRVAILINVIILSCSIVSLAYGGLLFWQKQGVEDKRDIIKRIAELDAQTIQAKENVKEIVSFQKKLKAVSSLLNNHIYWTNFFKFLEENTLADVYYSGFSGDTSGKYLLSATTKNYAGISRQINALKADSNVLEVKAEGGRITGQGEASSVNFSLDLKIKPTVFTE